MPSHSPNGSASDSAHGSDPFDAADDTSSPDGAEHVNDCGHPSEVDNTTFPFEGRALCWNCCIVALGGEECPEPHDAQERKAILGPLRVAHEERQREQAAPQTQALLDAVERLIRRYVVLPSDSGYCALALYALHTWAFESAQCTPYFVIESPEKQSGKSRLLEVLELVCRQPMKVAGISAAALYQVVEAVQPTLLIDEADAIFGGKGEWSESLRGVLNAGNRPGSPVIRGGKDGQPKSYDVYSPKVIAGINTGRLPDTIRDRSVIVAIDRKLRREKVERLRRRHVQIEILELTGQLRAWTETYGPALSKYDLPEPLEEISDRLEEAWEPLLAIADLARGDYPTRARRAAVELAGQEDNDGGSSHALLRALWHLFLIHEAMWTRDIVAAFNRDDALPFGEWHEGRGIKPIDVSRLLSPYRIRPRTVRLGGKTAKGYHREQFKEAWERYGADFAVTPVTSQQTREDPGFSEPSHDPNCDGSEEGENPRQHRDVTAVTAGKGDKSDTGPNGALSDGDLEAMVDLMEGGPPSDRHDLRGAPKGQTLEWVVERLVPRPGRKRRVRERVTLTYCADGWHSSSGSADKPYGVSLCSAEKWWDGPFDNDAFHAFHKDKPVVWRVDVQTHTGGVRYWYCGADLPDEWGDLRAEGEMTEGDR